MKSIISRAGDQNRTEQSRIEKNRGDQGKIYLSQDKEKEKEEELKDDEKEKKKV